MRTPNNNSVQFSVGNPGAIRSLEEMSRYVQEMESRVAAAIRLLAEGKLEMKFAEPEKPRMGDLALADGTSWNPGSGRGVYWFDEDVVTWNIMG